MDEMYFPNADEYAFLPELPTTCQQVSLITRKSKRLTDRWPACWATSGERVSNISPDTIPGSLSTIRSLFFQSWTR